MNIRRSVTAGILVLATTITITGGSVAVATATPTGQVVQSRLQADRFEIPTRRLGPSAAAQQYAEERLGPDGIADIRQAHTSANAELRRNAGLPAAGLLVAAAAWCARGALGSVATSVLDDIANGGQGTNYARNAIIGCLVGEFGGVVWKFIKNKDRLIAVVAAVLIRFPKG
ncbi:hypothetical protein [Nocardia brasiliensis]|uniref:Secreted protein n=1 Tax=Nocardia brasiliensis (strain ATCC 700358 / HUJEG-1) TaxID=1133849 RepID=K0F2E0_NOCB7|nr:hypothetical protein [Nocardia brasiliensis]AFU06333.1 hypothetical protein O3I_041940 [Nocardia brasiliensis ATCC 700358]OCF88504.1 hypothetical protein AW168_19370 [Nocardia brasiliensis]